VEHRKECEKRSRQAKRQARCYPLDYAIIHNFQFNALLSVIDAPVLAITERRIVQR
jgi:hypothetical protein